MVSEIPFPMKVVIHRSLIMLDCSTSGAFIINNIADASSLAACTTFSGSIAIATSFVGDLNLTLGHELSEISGSFFARYVNWYYIPSIKCEYDSRCDVGNKLWCLVPSSNLCMR